MREGIMDDEKTVTIRFPDAQAAQRFLRWLDNASGEGGWAGMVDEDFYFAHSAVFHGNEVSFIENPPIGDREDV
jgi:hypothetical protein